MKNTLCPLPWINIAQTANGSCTVCSNNIIGTSGITNDSVSTDFQLIRQEMLDGNIPNHCKKCFAEEETGIVSKRQQALKDFSSFSADKPDPKKLTSIEVYSKFATDIEDTSNIRTITFLEDNSLCLDSHYKFLIEFVADNQSADISLTYNLCTLEGLTNKIINIWNKFKHVTVNISLNGLEEKHDWFAPSVQFHKLKNYLDFLHGVKGSHVDLNITAKVNLLTAPYLDRLARWRRDSTFGTLNPGGELINLYLDTTSDLDIRRLPMHLKGYTKLKIERLLDQHRLDPLFNSTPRGRRAWQGIIDYMYSEDLSQNLADTVNYIKEQDSKNNTNWKEVFPELTDIEDDL